MSYSITIHKIIAIISFLVLSAVQFFLVYNTYELKNEHYFFGERELIGHEYSQSIRNDVLFPGGTRVLDTLTHKNMDTLEYLYNHDREAFSRFSQHLCDSGFKELRRLNNIDSLLEAISARHHLTTKLDYKLSIELLEIAFHRDQYHTLYSKYVGNDQYPYIDPSLKTKDGIWLGGNLEYISEQNKVIGLTVSSADDRSFRLSFSLHVDTANRKMAIFKLMAPTLILSLISILLVVVIYFITMQKWMRQKKLSEMKSDFINSITHEFHTPLSAIIVANRTLQNDRSDISRENVRSITGVIQRQAERLKALISQVLDITTMNQAAMNKQLQPVHRLLDDLLLDYRLKVGSQVELTLEKDATRDQVSMDTFWFTTMLLNIFDNAIKYNEQPLKKIMVHTWNDKKNLYIDIKDNGVGMTAETRQHLFEKFYRGAHTRDGKVKGLGLGLFYVKQAADAHQWRVEIQSHYGSGSTFTIIMPLPYQLSRGQEEA